MDDGCKCKMESKRNCNEIIEKIFTIWGKMFIFLSQICNIEND